MRQRVSNSGSPPHCGNVRRALLYLMETEPNLPQDAVEREKEKEAARKLARPPKDKREVTIGPTNATGPDVLIGG